MYTLNMATVKLSIQDKKDLDKFTKFLALKAAQIIVQSRLGEKVQTKCKPHSSGTDWFNLAIRDLPEVLAEAKRALCGEVVTARLPLCVEISLRTVEGDSMMLETWCLGVLPEQCDPSVRVTYTVYNRMGILLKSLVSVTRVTPAYKLSRRQGPDSYVICYRIYMGEPQLHNLGEGYNQVRVGQLCTPVGTLHLSVSYRTKMTISPQNTGRDNSIMLKSDHFHPDLSPKHLRYQQSEDNSASLSDTIKVGAFADSCRQQQIPLEPELEIPNVPFSSLLAPRQQSPPRPSSVQPAEPPVETGGGAEVEDDGNGNVTPRCDSRRSSCSMVSNNEDFIMVDLKTPFATTNANSELGAFYLECQSAPQLKTFSEQPTLAEQVGDITKTLEAFETSMQEYDEMLNSLCLSDNNN
ncbi:autophagy-related protein 13 homolog isoform X2 [Zootermopsis nevadensis]|uniref:Autophagy-related protein 13 n=1 Tax=Zootermopsis nevadensis TaxID=136037 RepID=A0A067QS73_ZOONE|nr:autophagy-related protein 13 homolog isoform X2 [Zootermopsis nevadensis]KDR12447.1 Autophagy-related protein 13-like protein [Zootermopsis nevadensis]